jgi:hypothetical protein
MSILSIGKNIGLSVMTKLLALQLGARNLFTCKRREARKSDK